MEYNEIILNAEKYATKEAFKEALATQIQLLLDNDYEVLIRSECHSVVILQIAHDHHADEWGADRFMLVTADEEADILYGRENEADASEEEENENV